MGLRLEDIELIKRVKYLYCHGIDTADIPLLKSIFVEDVEVDYTGGPTASKQRAALLRWVGAKPPAALPRHQA